MTTIIAGPRLDSLRFALLDRAAVKETARACADRLREIYANGRADGVSLPPAFWWYRTHCGDVPKGAPPIVQRQLDPWRLASINSSDPLPKVPTFRPDLTRSGYLGSWQSGKGGPGYLAIRDENARSSVHPLQFDLAAAWLWNFACAADAARAAVLWWAQAGVCAWDAASALLDSYDGHRVTRADVCVDHTLPDAWTEQDLNRFAGRSKARGLAWLAPPPRGVDQEQAVAMAERSTRRRELYKGPRSFTLYIGSRRASFMRIYDKTAEVGAANLGAYHATPVWLRNGWAPGDRIWRAELQVCSDSLRYLNTCHGEPMRQLAALDPLSLWARYSEAMRHVDLTATRLSRCPTSARWQVLQAASGDAAPAHRSPIELETTEQERALAAVRRAVRRAYQDGVGESDLLRTIAAVPSPSAAIPETLKREWYR